MTEAQRLDNTLIALADPTRRAILKRLARGEARISDLAEPFPTSFNAISKHVKILERARLIERRREGREHIVSFRPQPLNEVEAWVLKQRAFWATGLKVLDELLQKEVER